MLVEIINAVTTPQEPDEGLSLEDSHKANIVLTPTDRAMLQAYGAQADIFSNMAVEGIVKDASKSRRVAHGTDALIEKVHSTDGFDTTAGLGSTVEMDAIAKKLGSEVPGFQVRSPSLGAVVASKKKNPSPKTNANKAAATGNTREANQVPKATENAPAKDESLPLTERKSMSAATKGKPRTTTQTSKRNAGATKNKPAPLQTPGLRRRSKSEGSDSDQTGSHAAADTKPFSTLSWLGDLVGRGRCGNGNLKSSFALFIFLACFATCTAEAQTAANVGFNPASYSQGTKDATFQSIYVAPEHFSDGNAGDFVGTTTGKPRTNIWKKCRLKIS